MKIMIQSILLMSLLMLPWLSFAVLPVIDAASLARLVEELKQLKQQYDLLNQTYQTTRQELDTAKGIRQDAEGHYGFGSLLNGNTDLQHREWSPNNWDDALKGLSGGNPARYQQLVTEYRQNHPTLSQSDFEKGSTEDGAKHYQQQIDMNQAASVNATYAFNDIKQHLETVHQLSQQIESSPNTKASMDLNARLMVEVAYIQIQELKMQAVLNEQFVQQNSDTIASESASAQFIKLPDE